MACREWHGISEIYLNLTRSVGCLHHFAWKANSSEVGPPTLATASLLWWHLLRHHLHFKATMWTPTNCPGCRDLCEKPMRPHHRLSFWSLVPAS